MPKFEQGGTVMTRNEWELSYMKLMGDTIWLDETPEERRLARIEESMGWALETIEKQIERIRNLRSLKSEWCNKSRWW